MINKILKKFDKNLDEWVDTREHLDNCIGNSEGCLCCLDKYEPGSIFAVNSRNKLNELVKQSLLRVREEVKKEEEIKYRKIYKEIERRFRIKLKDLNINKDE